MRLLLSSIFLIISFGWCGKAVNSLRAQQLPHFVNQLQSPGIYNPARTGEGKITAVYRRQWLDLPTEEAPISYFVHADFSELFKLSSRRIGLGVQLIGDQAHIINSNRVALNFAYHLISNQEQRLSAGIQVGFLSQSLDFGDVRVNNPFDLELLSGSFSNGSFDGGPGLSYSRFFSGGNQLAIDLSALQLYSDRIDQDNGSSFDLQRHLMGRLSFKLALNEQIDLEPVVLYRRGIDELQLKSDQIDLAIRAHFMQRFTLGLGTRLAKDVNVFHLSFAANVGGPVDVMGGFETHPVFGGTYEAGLAVHTKKQDRNNAPLLGNTETDEEPEKIPVVGPPVENTSKPEVSKADLRRWQQLINTAIKVAEPALGQAKVFADETTSYLDFAARSGASEESKKYNLSRAETIFQQARNSLGEAQRLFSSGQTAFTQARSASGLVPGVPTPTSGRLGKLAEQYEPFAEKISTVDARLLSLETRLTDLRSYLTPTIFADIREGNTAAVLAYYQNQLGKITGLPSTFEGVLVKALPLRAVEISLPFSKSIYEFDLNNEKLADVKKLVDFAGYEIQRAVSGGLILSEVKLIAELRDPKDILEADTKAGTYVQEWGSYISSSYYFKDNETNTRVADTAIIRPGSVSFIKLTALKLEGMRRELGRTGVATDRVENEISAPANQEAQERYIIRFVLKPQ